MPRARPRAEQLIRAERLARRGLVSMLHPDDLTAASLGAWLSGPAPMPCNATPDMRGLDRVRLLAEEMLMPAHARAS